MIRFKSKVVAILGGAAMVASGALFASPAQAAMTCYSVPGQTIGADVKVGPVIQRVPAISGIQLCTGGATAPLASVTFAGGTCTSNCLTVTVGGGDADLEGATVSWREDGILKSQVINPAPVEGPDGTCVISVGSPDAPNPNCFIAIGPDDPSGTLAPIMQTVNNTVTTAVDTAETGVAITCSLIPDQGGYDFCTNPTGWTSATTNYAYKAACDRIPEMYDPWYGYYYEFCSDPIGWTNAAVRTARDIVDNVQVCDQIGPNYDYNSGQYVYFCDDPVGWTRAALSYWCYWINCDLVTIEDLRYTIQRLINENVQIQLG